MSIHQLVNDLYAIGAIKFGTFTLKSGIQSPIYIDLRLLVSHPKLLQRAADLMWEKTHDLDFDLLCGVPYTALPIASCISLQHNRPMAMRRKEVKHYGTKRGIEGEFAPGQTCLLIEDLVTSGASLLETVQALKREQLKAEHAVVLLDREQGGVDNLRSRGIQVRALFGMGKMLRILKEAGKIDAGMLARVRNFLSDQPAVALLKDALTYGERAARCKNKAGQRLLTLMEQKETNVSFNPDVRRADELLALADAVGPEICLLKTHIDIVEDFTPELPHRLRELADRHNFMIFEDRKFADIGSVVKEQYAAGIYKIVEWADITNAHIVPGPGVIEGLKQMGLPKGRGLLLLAQMSSKGSLAAAAYTDAAVRMAEEHSDFVIGFVTQQRLSADPAMIHLTPGVQLAAGADTLGQRFRTPEVVIGIEGNDLIQVGRGIYQADDPRAMAARYRQASWKAKGMVAC